MIPNLDKIMSAQDLFSGLSQEDENPEDKKFSIEKNRSLEIMISDFKKITKKFHWNNKDACPGDRVVDLSYSLYSRNAKQFSSKDIELFSMMIPEFYDEKEDYFYVNLGAYISSLINRSPDTDFKIHLNKDFDTGYIGFSNSRKNILLDNFGGGFLGANLNGGRIIVSGDTDNDCGERMSKGEIIVSGDAGEYTGILMTGGMIRIKGNTLDYLGISMKSGKIFVKGNTEDYLGRHMGGGMILVNGNSGKEVGYAMENGIISINGDYQSISRKIQGGSIFHKGKQIWALF